MAQPDEYGINLAPNTASSVATQVTWTFTDLVDIILQDKTWTMDNRQFGHNLSQVQEMTRMAAPYQSNCVDSWEYSGYNLSTNYALSVSSYGYVFTLCFLQK